MSQHSRDRYRLICALVPASQAPTDLPLLAVDGGEWKRRKEGPPWVFSSRVSIPACG